MNTGDTMQIGHYELQDGRPRSRARTTNYQWHRAIIEVYKDGELLGTLEPEKRFYKASRQGTREVGIRRRLNEDLYLNFAGMSGRQPARRDSGLRLPAGLAGSGSAAWC